jgi:hypothetical protein
LQFSSSYIYCFFFILVVYSYFSISFIFSNSLNCIIAFLLLPSSPPSEFVSVSLFHFSFSYNHYFPYSSSTWSGFGVWWLDYGLDDRSSIPGRERDFFSSPPLPDPASYPMGAEASFSGDKAGGGGEADQSLHIVQRLLPQYVFTAWCLVKHKDFTFSFSYLIPYLFPYLIFKLASSFFYLFPLVFIFK